LMVPSQSDGGKDTTSWLTQSQVLYNISLSLLHARRPHVAFELLLDVVASHYPDPAVWFHLAECCIQHHQPDNQTHISLADRASEVSDGGVGAGQTHKIIAGNPADPVSPTSGAIPVLTLDFAYVCLKNAESLLPKVEKDEDEWSYCSGVGYIGNPMSWKDVEQLRVAVLTAKSYVALAVGDFIAAGEYAETLLERSNLPGAYLMLANLYRAESLILQDKLSEAIKHLDPEIISDLSVNLSSDNKPSFMSVGGGSGWSPTDVSEGRAVLEYNLGVGFALREEWDKAHIIAAQLYSRRSEVSLPVLLLNLYIALRRGDKQRALHIVREHCPLTNNKKHPLQ